MKKTALTILLGCTLPLAAQAADTDFTSSLKNSDFSLYGSLRPTLVYSDSAKDSWDVGDALSRIGVKGSTEFAPGWKAIAQGEWKIQLNDGGKFGDPRLAYAGVASPYGQVTFGRQRPVQYTLVGEYTDIFNNANSPFAYNQESPFFADNLLLYKLQVNHFTLMASAMIDGEANNSGAEAINTGVGFDWEGLHLGLTYLEADKYENNVNVGKDKTTALAATYSLKNGIYLAMGYQDKDYADDRDGYTLDTAVAIPLAQDYKLKLGYFRFDDGIDDVSSLDYQGFNTTVEWNPVSNVRLHLEYLQQNNENRENDKSIAFGVRYDFDLNWHF
ncbi:porin [Shewanella sp. YIC-542]|uniref:porin n=1 Tax=Shewanella mytili TaxID=3377111 RepID=UPI00398F6F51